MKSFAYAGLACLCFALAWPATGSESSDIEFGRAAKLMENGDYANAIQGTRNIQVQIYGLGRPLF